MFLLPVINNAFYNKLLKSNNKTNYVKFIITKILRYVNQTKLQTILFNGDTFKILTYINIECIIMDTSLNNVW